MCVPHITTSLLLLLILSALATVPSRRYRLTLLSVRAGLILGYIISPPGLIPNYIVSPENTIANTNPNPEP